MKRDSFVPSEVLLLGPGPSPVSPRVLAAQAAPLLGHLDPDFLALMDRVQRDLRELFGTKNAFTLPISGTGSAGMETCFVNLVEEGDRVVVGINGVFGERMKDNVLRQGGCVVEVRAEYGKTLDIEEMRKAIAGGDTRIVAFVHAETSTGVLQDPAPICSAAKEHAALVVLDTVTSLGGCTVEIDRWEVDAAYSGTQKCLSVPPGLSPLTFTQTALAKVAKRKKRAASWYLDVQLLSSYWGGERVYHHTAPISAIYGLAAGLDGVMEEGLEARINRHREAALALYRGLACLGLELLVPEASRTPMLSSVLVPAGIDAAQVQLELRMKHKIEIGGGLGPLKGRIWRIGLMGHGARESSVRRVLAGLGEALGSQGKAPDIAAALAACSR